MRNMSDDQIQEAMKNKKEIAPKSAVIPEPIIKKQSEIEEDLAYEDDFIQEEVKERSHKARESSIQDDYEEHLIQDEYNLISARQGQNPIQHQETRQAKVEHRLNKSDLRRVDGEIFVELEPGNIIAVQALSNHEVNRSHIPEHKNFKQREADGLTLQKGQLLLPEDVVRCKSWRNGLLQQVFDLGKIAEQHLNMSTLTPHNNGQAFNYSHTLQKVELQAANRAPVEQLLLPQEEVKKRQKEDEEIDEDLLEKQDSFNPPDEAETFRFSPRRHMIGIASGLNGAKESQPNLPVDSQDEQSISSKQLNNDIKTLHQQVTSNSAALPQIVTVLNLTEALDWQDQSVRTGQNNSGRKKYLSNSIGILPQNETKKNAASTINEAEDEEESRMAHE
ncbi:hypothetical protein FGO68_gene7064 [Halteria grandinella]|uniref:Uncharacterized protein n=1 Tax=Halteria grandinella TaxID=5974 RepID=A0A8J8T7P6_HALGN|nr:hypothetical protein FGO68_gene7064 [Halteria grandinella]